MSSKLFKQNGFLSEEGEANFKSFLDVEIRSLLDRASTESECRIIGSLINKRVGDMVADKIQALKTIESKPACNGTIWRDEYGNESFTHDLYTLCPVCDVKK